LRKLVKWVGGALGAVVLLVVLFAGFQIFSFNRKAAAVVDAPSVRVAVTSDSAVLARGRHVAEALGGCVGCHGENLEGRTVEDMGPIGVFRASNLTRGSGGIGFDYTDDEMARAVRYGVGRDGRSLMFMPSNEHNWWPDEDLTAVISFVRSMPPVDNQVEASRMGPLGKILSNLGVFEMLSARQIDPNAAPETVPAPEPTARYGAYIARGCTGCHGDNYSGGPIPGAPADFAVPRNITPHAEELAGWTEATFNQVIDTGLRPDGTPLDVFMPVASLQAMNPTERTALWAFLQSLEPFPTGAR